MKKHFTSDRCARSRATKEFRRVFVNTVISFSVLHYWHLVLAECIEIGTNMYCFIWIFRLFSLAVCRAASRLTEET